MSEKQPVVTVGNVDKVQTLDQTPEEEFRTKPVVCKKPKIITKEVSEEKVHTTITPVKSITPPGFDDDDLMEVVPVMGYDYSNEVATIDEVGFDESRTPDNVSIPATVAQVGGEDSADTDGCPGVLDGFASPTILKKGKPPRYGRCQKCGVSLRADGTHRKRRNDTGRARKTD